MFRRKQFISKYFLLLLCDAGALAANRVKEKQDRTRSEDGKRKRQMEEMEKNTYKKLYIHASTKSKPSQPVKPRNSSFTSNKSPSNTDTHKERLEKIVMWNETGLELRNSNTQLIRSGLSEHRAKTGEKKMYDSKCLPRNISFVSSHSVSVCDSGKR